jgi:hypothetical protein
MVGDRRQIHPALPIGLREQVKPGLAELEFRDQLLVFLEGALGIRQGELGGDSEPAYGTHPSSQIGLSIRFVVFTEPMPVAKSQATPAVKAGW